MPLHTTQDPAQRSWDAAMYAAGAAYDRAHAEGHPNPAQAWSDTLHAVFYTSLRERLWQAN